MSFYKEQNQHPDRSRACTFACIHVCVCYVAVCICLWSSASLDVFCVNFLISLSQDRICFEGTKMALQVSKSLRNNRTIFNSRSQWNVTYLSDVNHIFFSPDCCSKYSCSRSHSREVWAFKHPLVLSKRFTPARCKSILSFTLSTLAYGDHD